MLTGRQQERYSRHLLLDGFDQERLLAARVEVRGSGRAARWAARYLEACGVEVGAGGLAIEVPGDDALTGARAALEAVLRIAT